MKKSDTRLAFRCQDRTELPACKGPDERKPITAVSSSHHIHRGDCVWGSDLQSEALSPQHNIPGFQNGAPRGKESQQEAPTCRASCWAHVPSDKAILLLPLGSQGTGGSNEHLRPRRAEACPSAGTVAPCQPFPRWDGRAVFPPMWSVSGGQVL